MRETKASDNTQQSARKPSVCFVATSPAMVPTLTSHGAHAMGGSELQLSLIGRALTRQGYRVSFLVGDCGQPSPMLTGEGIPVVRAYRQDSERTAAEVLLRRLPQFWKSLRDVDTDVYICRGLTGQAGIVAALAKLYRRRFVFWFARNLDAIYSVPRLSSLSLLERLPAWYAMRYADAIVVQTHDQKILLQEHVGRTATVIPNASSGEVVFPNGKSGQYALWLGSIRPVKDPHMVLDVAERIPETQFVVAGGKVGKYPELYRSFVDRADALTNVNFLGFVPFEETSGLFHRAGALLSTSETEGFPNVFLQAWSAGVPTVATCDPDSIIARHNLGFHCQCAADMAEAVSKIMASPQIQQQMGRRARDYVAEHHSIDYVVDKFDRLLRELPSDDFTGKE